ncbi:hypothetical protein RZS08_55330, partial [Arthrospira platensis SPKY1]|nr:hypothetical protein [Arthrospira platensis SPKY1]
GILPYNWWGNPILAPGLDGKMAGLAGNNTLFQIADSSDNDSYLYLYKKEHGNEVRLRAEEDFVLLNGQIHSASWDEDNHEAFARRIDQSSDEELASFSLLWIDLTDSSK